MSETTLAENLIQIWCRKKYPEQHEEGDKYYLQIGYEEDYSGCETCGGNSYGTLEIFKVRKNRHYDVATLRDANFHELLNEMLFALKPIEE